ncbi:MAG TPA: HaeIII family restriction endonuclease, partial [Kaistella chaponensis]|uniref:HaeIII family restriction endonuclease n=1 Tax=Kaistella chaponensis TaxID=713588 RepID=UPI002C391BA6
MATQTTNGKAFEFALIEEFFNRLKQITNVLLIDNEPLKTASKCFENFNENDKDSYRLNASFAVNFLLDIEPRLANQLNEDDLLKLEIVADKKGQSGDVRDVLAIRSSQNWEIGISAKNNHRAVKHSRLSNDINFGEKWLGISSSAEYFTAIKPIFDELDQLRTNSKATKKWSSLEDYHTTVYVPVLTAFKNELQKLDEQNPTLIASRLVEYLIGKQDFYKVIKGKNKVEIQAYNLHGTLNLPFGSVKPKAKVSKLKLPTRLIEIVFQENSKTTL